MEVGCEIAEDENYTDGIYLKPPKRQKTSNILSQCMICQKYKHEEIQLTETRGTKRFIEAASTRLDDIYF